MSVQGHESTLSAVIRVACGAINVRGAGLVMANERTVDAVVGHMVAHEWRQLYCRLVRCVLIQHAAKDCVGQERQCASIARLIIERQ